MLHEADELTDWKLIAHTLSEYLMCVLLDALAGVEYTTAHDVLNENGWGFYQEEYANKEEIREQLSKKKIDLSAMGKNMTFYGAVDSFYQYCFDEEDKVFYMIINDTSLMAIKAEQLHMERQHTEDEISSLKPFLNVGTGYVKISLRKSPSAGWQPSKLSL